MDKPIDLNGALAGGRTKVNGESHGETGELLDFGLMLARKVKRMVMAECEKKYPDSIAHQCTAAMVAAIVGFRAEENAALKAPEGTAPRNVWNSMVALLVPENLGFVDEDEANAIDGVGDE